MNPKVESLSRLTARRTADDDILMGDAAARKVRECCLLEERTMSQKICCWRLHACEGYRKSLGSCSEVVYAHTMRLIYTTRASTDADSTDEKVAGGGCRHMLARSKSEEGHIDPCAKITLVKRRRGASCLQSERFHSSLSCRILLLY